MNVPVAGRTHDDRVELEYTKRKRETIKLSTLFQSQRRKRRHDAHLHLCLAQRAEQDEDGHPMVVGSVPHPSTNADGRRVGPRQHNARYTPRAAIGGEAVHQTWHDVEQGRDDEHDAGDARQIARGEHYTYINRSSDCSRRALNVLVYINRREYRK